ncbi:MAG: hypothetical protein AAB342_05520, partial [Chloroflexota bacterium]
MDDSQINAIVEAVVKELTAARAATPAQQATPVQAVSPAAAVSVSQPPSNLQIDLPDPTLPEHRYKPRVKNPRDPNALPALIA